MNSKEVIVGIFFFVVLALLILLTVVIGNLNILTPPQTCYVYFDDVAGLREGNVVRVNGFEVGEVKKMHLKKQGVLARIELAAGVDLFPNHRIIVRSFSPLGGKFVDIERGDTMSDPIKLPDEKPGDKELDKALRGFHEPEWISEIADLAEKVKPLIVSAVANIRDVTEKVNNMQGTLGKLVGDPSMYNHLRNASRNLEETTASVNRVLATIEEGKGTLGKLVSDDRLYETTVDTLESVGKVTKRIDRGDGVIGAAFTDNRMRDDFVKTVSHVASILGATDRGEGTLGQLVRNDRLYNALSSSLEGLAKTTGQIADGKGPLGVLISDERAGENIRKTIASVEKLTTSIADGRGTVGRLFMDDRLIVEAERVMVELRESVEDFREQAPINAFIQAVFQAF